MSLRDVDPEIFEAIQNEVDRQEYGIELIASENFASPTVLEAMSNVMTNKYAEGYPGKRYYGGCEYVDVAENLARDRAGELFGCDHVNVQPHSGSQANMAVYMALLEVGDTIMGMDLSCGGHLTHGSPVNFSGKLYNIVPYGVDRETERLDYDEIRDLALEHDPALIMAGASAYPRVIDFERLREIADEVDAILVADIAHIAGLIVAGEHPNPVGDAQVVTTTTHKTLRGPRGGMIMCDEEYANDIDRAIFPGIQGGPLMHVIAAKATSFKEAMKPEFDEYQRQIVRNARAMASRMADHGYRLVSGGTDNHLFILDLRDKGITGKDAEEALEDAGITANKNTIPFDPESPFITSGVRIGTPAITTRGMKEDEMRVIADLIHRVLKNPDDDVEKGRVKEEVRELCEEFPLYR